MATNMLSYIIVSLCLWGASADRVQPCATATNKDACVGAYMASHSSCKSQLLSSAKLDPYTISHSRVQAPFFNLTGDWHDVTVKGLSNSKIVDFFYNPTSKKAVLTTSFPSFSMQGHLAFTALVAGDEGISFETQYTLFYSGLTITTIFNDYQKIDLQTSVSFVNMPAPPTNDHGASHGADVLALAAKYPEIKDLLNQMDAHKDVYAIEGFTYRAPILAEAYVNYKLCNFS